MFEVWKCHLTKDYYVSKVYYVNFKNVGIVPAETHFCLPGSWVLGYDDGLPGEHLLHHRHHLDDLLHFQKLHRLAEPSVEQLRERK